MSQPAESNPSPTITPSDSLSAPADRAELHRRAHQLSRMARPLFADRAELTCLLTLISEHIVGADEVWDALCDLYCAPRNAEMAPPAEDGPEWHKPLYADLVMVWSNLQLIATGHAVTVVGPPQQPESFEGYTEDYRLATEAWQAAERARTLRWFKQLMDYAGSLDHIDDANRLYEFEAVACLPPAYRHLVEDDYARTLFGSPYSLGVAIESLPTSGGGSCFGDENGKALLKALAYTVHWALKDVNAAEAGSLDHAEALGRLKLFWMILKGFVHSMAHANLGLVLANGLYAEPELVELVVECLTEGLACITSNSSSNATAWAEQPNNIGNDAASMATTALVELLRQRVERGRAAAEFRRSMF